MNGSRPAGLLAGRVAVITGSTAGIGRAVAEAYVKEGAAVVVNGRDHARGKAFLNELQSRGDAEFFAGSVTERPVVEGCIDLAVDRFGRLDIVVLNAGGVAEPAPIAFMTDESWEIDLRLNLTHTFWGIRRAFHHMMPARSGRVIAISSKAGKIGRKGVAGYVAAKHGVNGLVKSAALEVGELGITVNAVCPGSVLTEGIRERGSVAARQMNLSSLNDLLALNAAESAIKRQIAPHEVASLCVYLAGDASSAVTGQMLSVDGGTSPY